MLAMGASAQTPEKLKIYFDISWSAQQVGDKVGENLQLDFGGQYQAFNIVDADNAFAPAGYRGMRVDYELGSENNFDAESARQRRHAQCLGRNVSDARHGEDFD